VSQKPPDGNASTVLPGGEPRCPDTIQEWQAWIDERVTQYRGLRWSEDDARARAWGEAENQWHFRHGQKPDFNRCAGCGGPLVRSQGARQVDGSIVHLDGAHGVSCLIRYGEQWRSQAREALIALGLEPPSAQHNAASGRGRMAQECQRPAVDVHYRNLLQSRFKFLPPPTPTTKL
jgi:hypothetical protein